jgi:hypothetical protein
MRDLGRKFHYYWIIILIALIGWREPPYYYFSDIIGSLHTVRYTSIGNTSDPKRRSGNAGTFARYFIDIQEIIENTWIFTLEVVAQYQGIANFRVTCHNMWIQAHRDPAMDWLQLRYCIIGEDIEMTMQDWHNDWKIPIIHKEVLTSKEVEAGVSKKTTGDNATPKNSKPSQKPTHQKKGSAPKKYAQEGKKDTAPT